MTNMEFNSIDDPLIPPNPASDVIQPRRLCNDVEATQVIHAWDEITPPYSAPDTGRNAAVVNHVSGSSRTSLEALQVQGVNLAAGSLPTGGIAASAGARESPGEERPASAGAHRPELQTATPTARVARSRSFQPRVEIKPFDVSRVQTERCESGGGRAAVYNTYHGTGLDAEVLDVASGKGPNIGKAYAVGYRTDLTTGVEKGDLFTYPSGGGCELIKTVSSGAGGDVRLTGIAINTKGVYVVGNDSSGDSAFILKLSTVDLSTVSGWTYSVLGGSVRLNGVGISSNPAIFDVFAVGEIDDGSTGYSNLFVASFDSDIVAPKYDKAIDLGGASEGFSIDADRARNAYVGGRYDSGGKWENVSLRLNTGGSTIKWSYTMTYDAVTPFHENTGTHGVKVLGGTSDASALYITGVLPSEDLNPGGWANALIAKLDLNSGVPDWAWLHHVDDRDYGAHDITVDRDGYAYQAGYTGTDSDRDATLAKFDTTGASLVGYDFVGGFGTQDIGNAIDLVLPSTTSSIMMSGSTRTHHSMMYPTPSGCVSVYNGVQDGYTMLDTQPLPFGP
jgi:hypothetical protein